MSMNLTETIAALRRELTSAGLMHESKGRSARVLDVWYAGQRENDLAIEVGAMDQRIVIRRRAYIRAYRQTQFKPTRAGSYNWSAIITAIKARLDAIVTKRLAEDAATREQEMDDALTAMVAAQFDRVPDADVRVRTLDDQVYLTIACDKGAVVHEAALIAALLRGTRKPLDRIPVTAESDPPVNRGS